MTACSLDLGSLRCRIVSEEARYPEMLAQWYGGALTAGADADDGIVDLEIVFTADQPTARPETDRLVIDPTADGHRLVTDPLTCSLAVDGPSPAATFTVTDPDMDPEDLGFHIWLVTNQVLLLLGHLVLHAAGFVIEGTVAVVCGQSGAGKSTLAAALGGAGATLLSEDKVLVRRDGAGFAVSGVSGRMRLTAASEERLLAGRLDDYEISADDRNKRTFPAGRCFASDPHREHPIHHLLFLDPSNRVTSRPLSKRDALLALLDNTKWTVRFDAPPTYRRYLALVRDLAATIPAHTIERGEDFGELDALVAAVRTATRG